MSYNKIKVLPIIEAIRKRPGMYIGETNHPTHLFFEILDNCLDEGQGGYANKIEISINEKSFIISDNGRGMPQGYNKEYKTYDPIVACTVAHSGGKFDKDAYALSIGLHGVGMTAVNALSDQMQIKTWRNSKLFSTTLDYGKEKDTKISDIPSELNLSSSGTAIEVWPSLKHFKSISLEISAIVARLRLAKTFINNLNIIFNGTQVEPLSDLELCGNRIDTKIFSIDKTLSNGESFKLKFGYRESELKKNTNNGSVNLLEVNSGAHINIAERAIKEAWKLVVDSQTLSYLNEEDYLCGISSFILVNLLEPSYSSQTKEKLSGSIKDYNYLVKEITEIVVKEFKLKENDKLIENLVNKFKLYRQSINRASSTKFIDEVIELGDSGDSVNRGISLESKLIDCSSNKRETTELLITEGDSAGGGLISQRDSSIHAILPLRGKTLNVINRDIKQILSNLEIRSLINAMGAGCSQREDSSRVRYGKIILACLEGNSKVATSVGNIRINELESIKSYEDIKILSNDNGNNIWCDIEDVFISKYTDELIEIELESGETISCTEDHRIMCKDGSYKEAKDIIDTDELYSISKNQIAAKIRNNNPDYRAKIRDSLKITLSKSKI